MKKYAPTKNGGKTQKICLTNYWQLFEKSADEDEAVQFDPCDNNGENEDNFSNF